MQLQIGVLEDPRLAGPGRVVDDEAEHRQRAPWFALVLRHIGGERIPVRVAAEDGQVLEIPEVIEEEGAVERSPADPKRQQKDSQQCDADRKSTRLNSSH